MVLSKTGIWSWKKACQVLAGAKKPAGVTYCGVKYAVPCGTHDFQWSRTTRSAAWSWAVNRRTSGRWMSHVSLSDGGTGGSMSGSPLASRGPSEKVAMPRASWVCCTASSARAQAFR
jgi:hypothetical protein